MGWGDCGTDSKGRPIGYVHEATCDHAGCDVQIARGLGYACGGMHGTGEGGCEGYFCDKHLFHVEDPYGWVGRQKGFAVICEGCKNEHNARLVEDLLEQVKELADALDDCIDRETLVKRHGNDEKWQEYRNLLALTKAGA